MSHMGHCVDLAPSGQLPLYPRWRPNSRHAGRSVSCHFRTHAVQQMKTLFGFAVGTVVLIWKITKAPIRQVVRVLGLD
jgi:hypothetical protein